MTSRLAYEELKLLVVGDVDCGKTNFIEKFQDYYSSFLEIHRYTDDVYLIRIPDRSSTVPVSGRIIKFTCNSIRLHNINDIKILSNPKFYDKVDVILYCYASDNPKSLQNLEEKWIPLMKSETQYSFLVANLSDETKSYIQEQQGKVSLEEAKMLKKRFRLRSFVQYTDCYKKFFAIFEFFLEHALTRLYLKQFPETFMYTENEDQTSSKIPSNRIRICIPNVKMDWVNTEF